LLMMTLALCLLDRFPMWAGAALGLVMNIKYLSLGFLPYLLIRRRWAAAMSMLVWTVVFAVIPAMLIGWEKNLDYLEQALGRLKDVTDPQQRFMSAAPKALDRGMAAELSISVPSGVARIMKAHGHSKWIWPIVAAIAAAGAGCAMQAYR